MAKKPTGGLLKGDKKKRNGENGNKTYQGGEEPQKKYKILRCNNPKFRCFEVENAFLREKEGEVLNKYES